MKLVEDACKVIQSCIVLHNIAVKHRDYVDPLPNREKSILLNPNLDETRAGKIRRNDLVRQYFDGRARDMQRI
jgi:hypothetical protein